MRNRLDSVPDLQPKFVDRAHHLPVLSTISSCDTVAQLAAGIEGYKGCLESLEKARTAWKDIEDSFFFC